MINIKNSLNIPIYIVQCFLLLICLVSAALGRWMNYASIAACFGIIILFILKDKNVSISYTELLFCYFLLIYAVLGNIIYNGSLVEVYLLLNYIVVILFFVFVKNKVGSMRFACIFLSLFCFFEAIFIIMQEYAYGIWVKFAYNIVGYASNRISGFMSDYSLSGYVVAIGIVVSYYFIKNKYVKFLSVLINIWALLITTKRYHLLILLIGCVVIYFLTSKDKIRALTRFLIVFIFLLLVVLLYYYLNDNNNAVSRLIETAIGFFRGEDIDELTSNRATIYEVAIGYWQSSTTSIILGNGWGFFKNTFNVFDSIATAHNVYIQLLCETGLVGLIFFVIIELLALYHNILNVIKIKDKKIKAYSVISLYIQIHFTLYCFFGSPLYDTVCLFYYVLAISFSEYIRYHCLKSNI